MIKPNLEAPMASVAAVVVGTNDRRWLRSCLKTLGESSWPRLRIYFVDNCSTDGSAEFVASNFPDVTIVITNVRQGFAAANNSAVKVALKQDHTYVLFVNPDTQTPRRLIENLVSFMNSHLDFGIVGPIQTQYVDDSPEENVGLNEWSQQMLAEAGKPIFHHWYKIREAQLTAVQDKSAAEMVIDVPYVQGAALITRASIIHHIGLFDEMFVTFYEEVDFCRHALAAGWRVGLLPMEFIQHYAMGTAAAQSHYRSFYMERNKYFSLITDTSLTWLIIFQVMLAWAWQDVFGSAAVNGGILRPIDRWRIVWELCKVFPHLIDKRRILRTKNFRRRAHLISGENCFK